MNLTMQMTGLAEIAAKFAAFHTMIGDHMEDSVEKTVKDAIEVIKEHTPVSPDGSHGNKPGTLRDGNSYRQVEKGMGKVAFEAYNDVFYAGYVCLGTRYMPARDFMTPGLIYARARIYHHLLSISL